MRQKRIEYSGAIYHVMQRGNNKEKIFQNDSDKQFFIAELANSKKMYGFELYGYVLLDNHYHLLLEVGEIPLSKIMQRLNSLYSRYYNRVHERIDHLFGLRYKAIIIQEEKYLFAALRYLHWNPIRAGLVKEVADYMWSSDHFYRHNKSGLVNIDYIYDSISTNRRYAANEYMRLIRDQDVMEYEQVNTIFGSDEKGLLDKKGRENALDDILRGTGLSDEEFSLVKSGARIRSLKLYKKAYVKKAHSQGYTLKEIAANIKISTAAAHKLNEIST